MQSEKIGLKVAEAMQKIADEVNFVEKTGENTFQKYSYVSELDLLLAVRPIMMKYGVFCYPLDINVISERSHDRTEAVVTYRFVHAPSGEFLDVKVISAGADKGDKGPFKLMTGALKYALRQAFLIAAGDDPEAYDPDTGKRTSNETQQQHPMSKVIALSKKYGIDLLGDDRFASVWRKMRIDPTNLTSSSSDIRLAVETKELVKAILDVGVNNEQQVQQLIDSFEQKVKQIYE